LVPYTDLTQEEALLALQAQQDAAAAE